MEDLQVIELGSSNENDWDEFNKKIDDGSFFHKRFKLFVFLPTALILIGLWGTGIHLFVRPYLAKRKHS